MPSFSRLVNRLMLLNRVRHNKVLTTKSKADVAIRPFLTATTLPISLSQEIPQELYERIIDHLHNDIMSLLACSLVCRAWVPASRYHLFKHCVVHPLRLTWPGERNVRVNCAVSLSVSQLILYGADDGIYLSRTPVTSPKPALFLPDPVDHIDVLEDFNLIILLSAQQIFTVQLNILNLSAPRNISSCTRISSHVSSFSCGVLSGKHLVCAVKRGLSTTCKLLEPVLDINTQTYKLSPYKDFYIEERVVSLHFLKTKLVVGTRNHDFELVDVETLITQPLLHPFSAIPNKNANCVAVFRTHHGVIVCYSSIAVFVDHEGRPEGALIQWRDSSIYSVALHEPYLVAFGAKHFEIYYLKSGIQVQIVTTDYDLISTAPELFTIRTRDGQLFALEFNKL